MTPGELAVMLESGLPLKDSLAGAQPKAFGSEVELAVQFGAPLVPVLRQLETQRLQLERVSGELSQALAVPKATRKLLLWLPIFSLVFAQLMGLSSLSSLLNPLVLIAFLFGAIFLIVGSKISSRMLQRVEKPAGVRSLQQLQVALAAGMTLGQIQAWSPELAGDSEVRRLLEISFRTGAAILPLVQGQIQLLLESQLATQMQRMRELSVRILIPLGLTTLPAFLLFTIPPIFVGSINR